MFTSKGEWGNAFVQIKYLRAMGSMNAGWLVNQEDADRGCVDDTFLVNENESCQTNVRKFFSYFSYRSLHVIFILCCLCVPRKIVQRTCCMRGGFGSKQYLRLFKTVQINWQLAKLGLKTIVWHNINLQYIVNISFVSISNWIFGFRTVLKGSV